MVDLLRVVVVILTVFVTALIQESDSVNNTLEVPANVSCACPEQILTYKCNIIGGGNTLWGGTAFDCPSTSNEIILRHSQFIDGHSGSCSDGALTARSIGVMNTNCYTSQLQVTVRTSLNNTTIRCTHDSIDSGQIMIGSVSTIMVASGLDPPDSLKLVNIRGGQAILEWSPVISTCSLTITYNITSNCSSCSSGITNSTTASCPIPKSNTTTGDTICTFSIQSVVCDDISGEQSNPVVVIIPAQLPSVEIIPHYSDNDSLTKIRILGNDLLIATSDGTGLFITKYNVTYSHPTTGSIVDSAIVYVQRANETDITPPASVTSLCPFTITVAADNGFGQGLLSDPVTIGCTNQFVEVQYNSATSTITCTFLNQLDTSLKSCHISYGSCDQQWTKTTQGQENSSSSTITLSLESQNSFCYTVTARNGTFTIAVEGSVAVGEAAVSTGLIAGVVVAVVVLVLILLAVSIFVILMYFGRRKRKTGGIMLFGQLSIEVELNLQEISPDRFELCTIENSCKLREAAPFQGAGHFKRGYAYYEFKHEKENISEDKEIILMHKGTGHFFTPGPDVIPDTLRQYRLLGDGVKRPNLDNYTVFVQSTGSGARHLPAGSRLLYDQLRSEWQPNNMLLMKLTSNHFMKSTIESELTLGQFREKRNLKPNRCNVFLELRDVERKSLEKIRDVILMKDNGYLFTGPGARSMVDTPDVMFRIFILGQFKKEPLLKMETDVLHQGPRNNMKEVFHVLKVKQDNVQMSNFVEKELKVNFENGRAFYEFTKSEEDLLFYKEVVRMPKSIYSKYNVEEQPKEEHQGISESKYGEYLECLDALPSKLETGIMYYYLLPNVPGTAIKLPKSEDYKVFVQSTSQGSRCLKSNTLLLYKVTE